MKDPFRASGPCRGVNRVRIAEVDMVNGGRIEVGKAPRLMPLPYEQADLVSLRNKSPQQVGSDESARASQEYSLTQLERVLVVESIEKYFRVTAYFRAITLGQRHRSLAV